MQVVRVSPLQNIRRTCLLRQLSDLSEQIFFTAVAAVLWIVRNPRFRKFVHRDCQLTDVKLRRHGLRMADLCRRVQTGLHCHRGNSRPVSGALCRQRQKQTAVHAAGKRNQDFLPRINSHLFF